MRWILRHMRLWIPCLLSAVLFTAAVYAIGDASASQTAVCLPANELILSAAAICAALATTFREKL